MSAAPAALSRSLRVSWATAPTGSSPHPLPRKARAQGLNVFTSTLQEARFPPNRFDVITLFEVIEHVVEPLPLLRECHRILRPDGVLLIGIGNTSSWTVRSMGGRAGITSASPSTAAT